MLLTTPPSDARANLKVLAKYLASLPTDYKRFTMGEFYIRPYHDFASPLNKLDDPERVSCGTVACAVGHAPSAGIPVIDEDKTWTGYAFRALVPDSDADGVDAFLWMFGAGWENTDNTPRGAAKRIKYYLEHGIPSNATAQAKGKAPLCY